MATESAIHNRRMNRRAAKRSKLKGVTVAVIGGGGGDMRQAVAVVEQAREQAKRVEAHQKRWLRFLARWGGNARFAWHCDRREHWEAWQSLIPIRENPECLAWWFSVSDMSRMELCDIGRQWRASNRRQQRLYGRVA